ncbi:hypothetical protein PR048_005978 [Dryococelus australis]|uniref:Uncharacterized protein n=1 Tax=Dryococelus australis TaxID=614101 RepID=A0ABQ9I9P1_9NEOP|nr:hypothetical protein PR048_005978 [Dryococelus australis]
MAVYQSKLPRIRLFNGLKNVKQEIIFKEPGIPQLKLNTTDLKHSGATKNASKYTKEMWRLTKTLAGKNKKLTAPAIETPQGYVYTRRDKANSIADS